MVSIKIIEGDCFERGLAKEELKGMIRASHYVISNHDEWMLWNHIDTITVELVPPKSEKLGKVHRGKGKGGDAAGCAISETATFRMRADVKGEQALTIIFHEILHLMWPKDQTWSEHAVTILTNRFKEPVTKVYNVMMEEYSPYKRAAWIAHAKMSYHREAKDDEYDDSQWVKTGVTTKGGRYHPREKANDRFFNNLKKLNIKQEA